MSPGNGSEPVRPSSPNTYTFRNKRRPQTFRALIFRLKIACWQTTAIARQAAESSWPLSPSPQSVEQERGDDGLVEVRRQRHLPHRCEREQPAPRARPLHEQRSRRGVNTGKGLVAIAGYAACANRALE
jgi:hypothetical protein